MSAENADRACTAFDASKPKIARGYDCLLGGKDNYAAERAEAERLLRIYPRLRQLARENRLFLANAVTWLARQGIGQFQAGLAQQDGVIRDPVVRGFIRSGEPPTGLVMAMLLHFFDSENRTEDHLRAHRPACIWNLRGHLGGSRRRADRRDACAGAGTDPSARLNLVRCRV
jgi:S-adenosyl methyltransferase